MSSPNFLRVRVPLAIAMGATIVFPTIDLTQLHIDDANVCVVAQSSDNTSFEIRAASKNGGAAGTVWKGLAYPGDVHLDANNF